MNRPYIGQALRGLAFFFGTLGVAHAGSFSVNPVRVNLSASQPVAAITVRNESSESTLVQLETFAWSQSLGKDATVATSDVLATPPIFTLAPKGTQIVRIGLRKPAPSATSESTYRITLREVPPKKPAATGLNVTLLVSMPIFVAPPVVTSPDIRWRVTRAGDKQLRLQATNAGTAHAQIAKLDVSGADGTTLISRSSADYVLPGNTRMWMLDTTATPAIGAKLKIATTTDFGTSTAEVPLEAP
jgi:fimbrial chaperone protein